VTAHPNLEEQAMHTSVLARIGLAAACAAVAAGTMTTAQTPPPPQPVVVVNQTRFVPVAHDMVVPAGQSHRFEVRSDGFSRVSLLIAGTTTPGTSGGLKIATLYGPPFVPGGLARAVAAPGGEIRSRVNEPVLGPAMAIVVSNETGADVTLTMNAYLAN
jgi:hypothetical protein